MLGLRRKELPELALSMNPPSSYKPMPSQINQVCGHPCLVSIEVDKRQARKEVADVKGRSLCPCLSAVLSDSGLCLPERATEMPSLVTHHIWFAKNTAIFA